MSEIILNTLKALREYARQRAASRACHVEILCQQEQSRLMRFANSGISLNTSEDLTRVRITATDGRRRATISLITDLARSQQIEHAVDQAMEMAAHAQPLTYDPTVALLEKTHINKTHWDASLAAISGEEKLVHFNTVAHGQESGDVTLSGIFSSGSNTLAKTNTRSDHTLLFKTSDAQVTAVLSHAKHKWELIAEQSAQHINDLDPSATHDELKFIKRHYEQDEPRQLDIGRYDIVFGPAATAALVGFMNWIGFDGGLMKRGYSFLDEGMIGSQVFSPKFSVTDDPTRPETFPLDRDMTGLARRPFPLIDRGKFCGFTWSQDDADEFRQAATGHTVPHKSLVVAAGDRAIGSLEELVGAPRQNDILYIPFLHYMNVVNPSRGLVTASSRFGALLLKKQGGVDVPFNVRLTRSLPEIFGNQLAWLSSDTVAYNTSSSYDARNPTAMIVPRFIKINDLEISHATAAY